MIHWRRRLSGHYEVAVIGVVLVGYARLSWQAAAHARLTWAVPQTCPRDQFYFRSKMQTFS